MHAICRYQQNQTKEVVLSLMMCLILFIIQMVLLTEISGMKHVIIRSVHTEHRAHSEKREGTCLAFIQDYLCMSTELLPELRHTVPLTLLPSLPLGKPLPLNPSVDLIMGGRTDTPVQLFC